MEVSVGFIVIMLLAAIFVLVALVVVGVVLWKLGKKFIWNRDGSEQEDSFR